MFRIDADHANNAGSMNELAFVAHFLN